MRYIEETTYKDRKGKPFPIKEREEDELHDATTGELLRFVLVRYTPSQALSLVSEQLRDRDKLLGYLEGTEREVVDGRKYLAIEDAHFNVLHQVVDRFCPMAAILADHTARLLEILDAASKDKPKAAVPEPAKEPVSA